MKSQKRTPKETLQVAAEEAIDAVDLFVIISHSNGTISSHGTTNALHVVLGMLRSEIVIIEDQIRSSSLPEPKKGVTH